MKSVIILALIGLGLNSFAQQSEGLSSMKTERIEEINQELEKLHKKIYKTDKALTRAENETYKANSELTYKINQGKEVQSKISSVRNEMSGHNYMEMKEYILRTKKKNKTLKESKRKKANQISKKAARMEKIKEDIRVLEEGIFNDEMEIRQNRSKIEAKEDIIKRNNLDDKSKKLINLNNKYKKLEKSMEKLNSKVVKNNHEIEKHRKEALAIKTQIKDLKSEREELISHDTTSLRTS